MSDHLSDPHFQGEHYVGIERRTPARQRILGLVDYRTLVAFIVLLVVLLSGFVIVTGQQDRHRALDAAVAANKNQTDERRVASEERKAMSEKLQNATDLLAALIEDVHVLRRQLQEAGITPAVPERTAAPTPHRSASPTARPTSPSPRPSPSPKPSKKPHPSPKPSPSPTCTPLPIIGCR